MEAQSVIQSELNYRPKLSEQQCLDCAYEGLGCDNAGSDPDKCISLAKGIAISYQYDYPYAGVNEECKEDTTSGPLHVNQVQNLTAQDAETIRRQLDIGVVIATIDSSCVLFKQYKTDILGSSCSLEITTDHTVLIVGYGSYTYHNDLSVGYFIVRNSWGEDWGINGYMYVAFEEGILTDGVLGIQQAPQYIQVKKATTNGE